MLYPVAALHGLVLLALMQILPQVPRFVGGQFVNPFYPDPYLINGVAMIGVPDSDGNPCSVIDYPARQCIGPRCLATDPILCFRRPAPASWVPLAQQK